MFSYSSSGWSCLQVLLVNCYLIASQSTVDKQQAYMTDQLALETLKRINELQFQEIRRLWQRSIPTGSIQAYIGLTVPKGWLLCDGKEVSRVEYAELFAVIGTSHGSGDNISTFSIPDYRGLFLRGVSGDSGIDPASAGRTAMNPGGNAGNAVGSVQQDAIRAHQHEAGTLSTKRLDINASATASPEQRTVTTTTSLAGEHTHSIHGMVGSHVIDFSPRTSSGYNNAVDPVYWKTTTSNGAHLHNVDVRIPDFNVNIAASIPPSRTDGSTAWYGDLETRPKNANVNYIVKY